MSNRVCRVGLHGRNHDIFEEIDYQVIREARIETVKMMSNTRREIFERIKGIEPNIEIITRLYDDRIGPGRHPTPQEFADKMVPAIRNLQSYCTKFQIHNEPNHKSGKEGWGPADQEAESFNDWFLEVYTLLRAGCPWASFGFPGLAVPGFVGHRDLAWLKQCQQAIERADWLGVHCYWQTPPGQPTQAFHPELGLRFKIYHQRYPHKALEILECGNSNYHNPAYAVKYDDIAQEYVAWLQELFKYDYVRSASFFILSSHYGDAPSRWEDWWPFSWRTRDRNLRRPVVYGIGQMYRPPLGAAPGPPSPPSEPQPEPSPEPRPPAAQPPAPPPAVDWTNQQVITAFARASVKLGLGNWTLMGRAGIRLDDLARDRSGPYRGPGIAQLSRLTAEQKDLILGELAALARPAGPGVSFGLGAGPAFLQERPDLATIELALPRNQQIDFASARNYLERRVARAWNRYGYLLMQVSGILDLDLGLISALLAAEADRRGLDRNGRLVIRFEPHIFYEQWGKENQQVFHDHYAFDAGQPWQKHQWRSGSGEAWLGSHRNQDREWAAFDFACGLDGRAAKLSTGLGLARMIGFVYAAIGYESVEQMFDAFASSERYQILAVFDLIAGPGATSRCMDALREGNLDTFAALNHGSQQAARSASRIRGLLDAFRRLNPLD